LNRLGTLTYAPPFQTDERALRRDVAAFFKRLRESLGGAPSPYLWVPEWHKDGERLHAHFGVGRFIKRSLIDDAWGHGFVHIKLLGDLPVGSGARGEARRAAGYLGKYAGKDVGKASGRLHRYEIAQGFQPRKVRLRGRTADAVLEQACEVMGAEPARSWSSAESPEWYGAPAVWFAWD
jgi:hypothetical protein